MSGYAESHRDQEQATWMRKWVPEDDPIMDKCPAEFAEQYRFTLARARSAEAEVETYKRTLRAFQDLIGRTTR